MSDSQADRGRLRLRSTFDEDAELYDRARPGYPSQLFSDLKSLALISGTSHILEIGPGTGQFTRFLSESGAAVTAIDLGPGMVRVARRNLAACSNVNLIHSSFEDFPLPPQPFDVVVSATAFHWIDPTVRLPKSRQALRTGGHLAVIASRHMAGGTVLFWQRVERCYEAWFGAGVQEPPNRVQHAVSEILEELQRFDRFASPRLGRYEWEVEYTSETYLDLLRTYSELRTLPAESRERLLECVRRLIDEEFRGRIRKRHLTELVVAEAA